MKQNLKDLTEGFGGSTTTLVAMFTGFLIGVSGGINVLVAFHYGAKDKNGLRQTIHSSLYLLYVFSWTITAIAEILYFVSVYRATMRNV